MRHSRTLSRWPYVFFALMLSVILAIALGAQPASAATQPPSSMAALGDSITRGFNACGFYVDCTHRSWSTGGSGTVNSHYKRFLASNPDIEGNRYNVARSGARSDALATQAQAAMKHNPEYLTILIGANDACRSSVREMTSVKQYRDNVEAALNVIEDKANGTRIFLSSIPNVHHLWSVGKDSWRARMTWSILNVCQAMLKDPLSTDSDAVDRRNQVKQRVEAYNKELKKLCSAYGSQCVFDNYAVYNTKFTIDDVSEWDFFHPNKYGQRKLAAVTYNTIQKW